MGQVDKPSFDILDSNNLNCMIGFASFLDVLRKARDDVHINLYKKDNIIHLSYSAIGDSGILYKAFEL